MATKKAKVNDQAVAQSNTTPGALPTSQSENPERPLTPPDYGTFPPTDADSTRLTNYHYYDQLFNGDHFGAFTIRARDPNYSQMLVKLRYIKINFAGLISRIMADMLFSEQVKIKCPNNQEFVDAFIEENHLHTMLYESELTCSSLGDADFKLRVDLRHEGQEDTTVILDHLHPTLYFPKINSFNVNADPDKKVIAWKVSMGDEDYVRQEIHTYKKIENKLFLLKGSKLENEVDISLLSQDIAAEEEVKIDECLIQHIPNYRKTNMYFGISDYIDLDSIFFGINNRMTMVDNILDKHSDPILMVPPGVLNDKGQVKKKALGVIEYEEGTTGKPEYIVWDASLENAFKEIDKLTEMFFMISETSPDLLGMGQGQAESGRALKLKLLRTIAKARRKRLYYDTAIKEIVYKAQKLSVAYNAKCGGLISKAPERPTLEWSDGLPNDDYEAAETEQIRLDSGNTTKKASIMRLDGVDEPAAEKMVKEIDDEHKVDLPVMSVKSDIPGSKPNENPVK